MTAIAVALGAAAILIGSGCGKKRDESSGGGGTAGSATPATPPTRLADRLIKEALARNPASMTINRLTIDYVAPDGTLAQQYGALEITLQGPEPGPPPDDPSRPTGAPVPAPTTQRECRAESWENGRWVPSSHYNHAMCFGSAPPGPLRCTVLAIWSRAITDGAPRDALAKIRVMQGMGAAGGSEWDFTIEDAPRNISFRRSYPDDCDPTVEAPATR
jgi:hypothetical protein